MINGEERSLPPSSNTGVVMSGESGLKLTVDWLEGTSFNLDPDDVIRDILRYPRTNFVPTKKGAMGYMNGMKDGDITIWYNGSDGMGVHFSLTGNGCRQYENVLRESDNPLFELMKIIDNDKHVKISRLDLAIDDFEGIFKIPTLVRKVKNGEVISKFKKARKIEDMLIQDGSSQGTTLYFGSPKSEVLIRMYEKNYQMGLQEQIPFWNRTEIQLRDDKAKAALREICSDRTFGEVCFGIVSNYITFVDIPLKDRKLAKEGKKKIRKDRYPINQKWLKFIGGIEKLKLTVDPKTVTMKDKYKHLMRQASKAFVMLEDANYAHTEDILEAMRRKGFGSLTAEDINIIRRFKEERTGELVFNEKEIK